MRNYIFHEKYNSNSATLLCTPDFMTSHMLCNACVAEPYIIICRDFILLQITSHFMLCCHFLDGFLYLSPSTSHLFFLLVHPTILTFKCCFFFWVITPCTLCRVLMKGLPQFTLFFRFRFSLCALHCTATLLSLLRTVVTQL